MDRKSQFYFAYVAGLDPLQLLRKSPPDRSQKSLPAARCDEIPADLPREPSRRRRALLLLAVGVGLAIGAWQLLSDFGAAKAAHLAARDFASERGLLLLILFLGLMIGAGELLTRIDASR